MLLNQIRRRFIRYPNTSGIVAKRGIRRKIGLWVGRCRMTDHGGGSAPQRGYNAMFEDSIMVRRR
jgi:hypothetical protein